MSPDDAGTARSNSPLARSSAAEERRYKCILVAVHALARLTNFVFA